MNRKTVCLVALMVMLTAHAYGRNICGGHGTFRVQVGSFREAVNAKGYMTRLRSACFSPVLERHGCLYRVVVPVGGSEELGPVVQRLRNVGFRNVWIRGGGVATQVPRGQNVYRVLIGSFREPANAQGYFTRLLSAGFNPALELFDSPCHGTVIRVLVPDVGASERAVVTRRLGTAGFKGTWMRG